MISDRSFPLAGQMAGQSNIDDLPRTLRREHEARAQQARERDAQTMGGPALSQSSSGSVMGPAEPAFGAAAEIYDTVGAPAEPYPAVVKALDIPFGQLVLFCLKVAVAAIPALLLLMVILWGVGQAIEMLMPNLLKMKILITFPNS